METDEQIKYEYMCNITHVSQTCLSITITDEFGPLTPASQHTDRESGRRETGIKVGVS